MQKSSIKLEQLPIQLHSTSMLTRRLYHQQIQQINLFLKPSSNFNTDKVPENLKSLAHLNSQQLLILLDEWIFPLSQRYEYLNNQEHDQATTNILTSNHEKLLTIKQEIYHGLLARCQISTNFHLPRHVDDLMVYDPEKAKNVSKLSSALDDDKRLIIYDTLLAAGFAKETLDLGVISMIPKRSYQPLQDAKTHHKAINKTYGFSHKVCTALAIKRKAPSRLTILSQRLNQKMSAIAIQVGLPKWRSLWQFRYLFYFILSFAAYYLLSHAMTIMGVMMVSEKLFAWLVSGLFYTVAMFPLWYWVGQTLKESIDWCCQKWRSPKQSQIVDSLLALEQNEQFIQRRLSQVIVDIIHYDFDALKSRLLQMQTHTGDLSKQLQHFSILEKIVCDVATKEQVTAIKRKLQAQESALKISIKKVIEHITLRVKEEFSLLEKQLDHQGLLPVFPDGQYKKINAFIKALGKPEDVIAFQKQANIAEIWMKKLDQMTFVDNHSTSLLVGQPWGGHMLRQDVIRGWQILLKHLGDESNAHKSARAVNELLRGRKNLTASELLQAVKYLLNKEQPSSILSTIQSILFNTLHTRQCQQAALLSLEQKTLIASWYELNKEHVASAKNVIRKVFSENNYNILNDFTNKQLARMYQILDGADIYYFSQNQSCNNCSSPNQVRQFFERFQGESSRAFQLCRFVPEYEAAKLLANIAKKRLSWIIENLDKGVDPDHPFDEYDIEFFLQHTLSKQHDKFNVTKAIKCAMAFSSPWTKSMERFLESCRRHGLDSGRLLQQYQAKNIRMKAFMLQHHIQATDLSRQTYSQQEWAPAHVSHKITVC